MTNDPQSSASGQDAPPIENEGKLADQTATGDSQGVSLSEKAKALGIKGDFAELDKDTVPKAPAPKKPEKESSQSDEGSKKEPDIKPGTLGERLSKEAPVTFHKKNDKFPDVRDGDVVDGEDGKPIIKAKHVYDDMNSIFGVDGKTEPRLETFFLINKHKPEKADVIAKAAGFRSRHHLAAAIEEFREADADDQQQILNDQFPEWTHYNSGVDAPFTVDLDNSVGSEPQAKVVSKKGDLPWDDKELDSAIDSYVADNDNVTKQDILESVKLEETLVELSVLQKGGKVISAFDALKLAMPQVKIERVKLSDADRISLGGSGNQPPLPEKKPEQQINSGMKSIMGLAGINAKEFEDFEKSKS